MWMWHKKSNLDEVLDKLVKTEEKIYEARDISRKFFFKTKNKICKLKKCLTPDFSGIHKRIKKLFKR
jgi:septation ring formation regulator EzrA